MYRDTAYLKSEREREREGEREREREKERFCEKITNLT